MPFDIEIFLGLSGEDCYRNGLEYTFICAICFCFQNLDNVDSTVFIDCLSFLICLSNLFIYCYIGKGSPIWAIRFTVFTCERLAQILQYCVLKYRWNRNGKLFEIDRHCVRFWMVQSPIWSSKILVYKLFEFLSYKRISHHFALFFALQHFDDGEYAATVSLRWLLYSLSQFDNLFQSSFC